MPRINFGSESLQSSLQATHLPPPELHRIMNTELGGARLGPNSQNHVAWPVREPNHHRRRRAGVPLRDRARSRISLNRLRPIAPSLPPFPIVPEGEFLIPPRQRGRTCRTAPACRAPPTSQAAWWGDSFTTIVDNRPLTASCPTGTGRRKRSQGSRKQPAAEPRMATPTR